MMLRVSLFPAMLAAGVALSVAPAVSVAQSRAAADVTSQRTSQSPYQGTVVEDIVAMVNDQAISKSDYDRAEQEMEAEARQQGWSQAQLMAQRRDLLRSLIDNQLLLSKGKDLGITGETRSGEAAGRDAQAVPHGLHGGPAEGSRGAGGFLRGPEGADSGERDPVRGDQPGGWASHRHCAFGDPGVLQRAPAGISEAGAGEAERDSGRNAEPRRCGAGGGRAEESR